MAFIGTPLDTRNTFQSLAGKRFNGDGSTTAFTLDVAPSSTLDIEVFVGNVRQDPNSAYTLSGTTLTFTGAPPSGTNNIYVVHQAKSVGTIDPPATETIAKTFSGGVTMSGTTTHSGTLKVDTVSENSSGNGVAIDGVTLKDNGVVLGTGGINFPDSQTASADANTLDDYEEGSWTPTSASISFSSATGRYVKIGAQVTCWFQINFPSTSNSSDARVTGIPFNPVSQNGQGVLGNINNTDIADVRVSADSGNSFINLRNEAGAEKTNANLSSRNIRGMITYLQAAD
ncbi:MAG: hypothetical protein CBC91_02970 [Rickettsiales bacterium TMED131]|nr:MAG: hypothetical protein CBC91_02970 [Rickettsiales bacterium TMED131]